MIAESGLSHSLLSALTVRVVWNHETPQMAIYHVLREAGLDWRDVDREELKQLVVAAVRLARGSQQA